MVGEQKREKGKRQGEVTNMRHGGRRGQLWTRAPQRGGRMRRGARSREEHKMKCHMKLLPLYPDFKN